MQWHASHIVSRPVYPSKVQQAMTEQNKGSQTHFSRTLLKQSRLLIQKLHKRPADTGAQLLLYEGAGNVTLQECKAQGVFDNTRVRKGHFETQPLKTQLRNTHSNGCVLAVHPGVPNQQLGREMQIKGSLLSISTCVLHQSLFT